MTKYANQIPAHGPGFNPSRKKMEFPIRKLLILIIWGKTCRCKNVSGIKSEVGSMEEAGDRMELW